MGQKIEISQRSIVFTLVLLVSLGVLYLIRDIILAFFVALLIMAVLDPFVAKLSDYKVPRGASVLLAYVLLFAFIGFTIAAIVPPLAEQTTSFVNNLPATLNTIGISAFMSEQIVAEIISQLGSLPAQAARVTISLFSNVLGIVAVLVFAFYLLSERHLLDEQIGSFFGDKKKVEIERIIGLIEDKLGGWARAQLTLMFVVGTTNYVGLRLLGIPFALPLSILAGILEIVPYVGPTLAAVPAVLIGLGVSPVTGLAVAALAFLIQQLENYVLVPKIMQKSAGLNPIVTLLALSIGFRLAGMVGLIISVPVYVILQILVKEYLLKVNSDISHLR